MIEITSRQVDEILADAHAVAYPRYPGTEGDRRAIPWVAGKLAAAGLEVATEEFSYDLRPALRAVRAFLVAVALLLAAAGLLAERSPAAAGLLLGLGLAAGAALLGWSPGRERIYAGEGPTRTANVAGRYAPGSRWQESTAVPSQPQSSSTERRPCSVEGKALPEPGPVPAASVEHRAQMHSAGAARDRSPLPRADPRVTVILLAHHDSKSQNLTFPWRMGMTLLALAGGLALAALLLAGAVAGGVPGPPWLPAAAGCVAAAALLVLSTLANGDRSPGGVDNAGSLAIVLQLAKLLPGLGPDDVEWIFLSPGAEEDHMVGAMRWLDRHREELSGRPVWAINFDGAGNPGRIALLERFGFGRAFSPELSAAARRSASELGIKVRGVYLPPAMGLDSIPFVHRGFPCLTISSGSLGRATLAVHSAGDVAELLDRDTLERAAKLGAALALRMAGEGGQSAGSSRPTG